MECRIARGYTLLSLLLQCWQWHGGCAVWKGMDPRHSCVWMLAPRQNWKVWFVRRSVPGGVGFEAHCAHGLPTALMVCPVWNLVLSCCLQTKTYNSLSSLFSLPARSHAPHHHDDGLNLWNSQSQLNVCLCKSGLRRRRGIASKQWTLIKTEWGKEIEKEWRKREERKVYFWKNGPHRLLFEYLVPNC